MLRYRDGSLTGACTIHLLGKADGCPTSNYPWENDRTSVPFEIRP